MSLICLRCGRLFTNKSNLNKHYKRKMDCSPTYYDFEYTYLRYHHNLLKKIRCELNEYLSKKTNPKTCNIKLKYKMKPIKSSIKSILKIKLENLTQSDDNCPILVNEYNNAQCDKYYKCYKCNKIYNHRSSLHRHMSNSCLHKNTNKKTNTLLSQILKKAKKNKYK
jgi:hypothetical protein